MPAAYDTTSRRFDDLMAEVCPGAVAEVHARIDNLRREWQANGWWTIYAGIYGESGYLSHLASESPWNAQTP